MEFVPENIYDLANLEFTNEKDFTKFVLSCKDADKKFHTVASLAIVNAIKTHPDWFDEFVKQSGYDDTLLFQTCLILAHKGFIAPEKIIDALTPLVCQNSSTNFYLDIVDLLQRITVTVQPDLQFRVAMYSAIVALFKKRGVAKIIPGIIDLMVKDSCNIRDTLFISLIEMFTPNSNLEDSLARYIKNNRYEDYVTAFLHKAITINCHYDYDNIWHLIYTLIGAMNGQLNKIIDLLRSSEVVFSHLRNSPHIKLWKSLMSVSGIVNLNCKELYEVARIIPYIPEDKFFRMLEHFNPKSQDSVVLLNHPAVVKNEKIFATLLRSYLNSDRSDIKHKEPLVLISPNIIRNLSNRQVVKLVVRSIERESNDPEGLRLVRFAYSPEAITEIKVKLTAALAAGTCNPSVMDMFFSAYDANSVTVET